MPGYRLERFWRAVESLPGLAAVAAEWEALAGDDLAAARAFLRPRAGLAGAYPRPGGGLPYDVVDHGPGGLVGVCPETGETVPLAPGQLVVYELDRPRVAAAVAAALGVDPAGAGDGGPGGTTHVGRYVAADRTAYACFLALPAESDHVHLAAATLVAAGHAPLALFVPTRRWVRHHIAPLLKHHASVLIPLVEAAAAGPPGGFEPAAPVSAFLTRATGVVSLQPAPTGPAGGENRFRPEDGGWAITFAGQTIRTAGGLGFRYLAALIAAKHRPLDAAALRAGGRGVSATRPAAGLEVIDRQAFHAYRARVDDLTARLQEAKDFNDLGSQEHLQHELAAVTGELAAASGLGGRLRTVKDESDSTRTAVTNAISRAVEQCRPRHAALARHLDASVRTGRTLCYSPDPDVEWTL